MKKCALIIGINDTPGLPYLASPCDYARRIETWAKSQGFETKLFVDETGQNEKNKIRVDDIMEGAEELLRVNPSQLLIYFAGHGFELYPGNDIWLLPEYERWSHQAIDVEKNRQLAFDCGADHIIFISDACRIADSNHRSRQVVGSAILPSLHKINYDVAIDTLNSTWPNQPSIEYRDESGKYRSIYSECLLECLQGEVHEIIRNIKNPDDHSSFPAVICRDLSVYLKRTVPIVTAQKTSLEQHPNSSVNSDEPIYISKFDTGQIKPSEDQHIVVADPQTPYETDDPAFFLPEKSSLSISQKLRKIQGWTNEVRKSNDIDDTLKLIESVNHKMVNESLPHDKTGFIIHGNKDATVYDLTRQGIITPDNQYFSGEEFTFLYYDYKENHHRLPLIVIGNAINTQFYPVSILPGFIASIIFNGDELINIDYLPTHGYRRNEAIRNRLELARRKAQIVTAAKNGIFQGSEELASYIRRYKSLDPTLGLFAAYAYFQNGKFSDVRSVFRYMQGEFEPVLPEVRLLTYLSNRSQKTIFNLSPDLIVPMLTQGWSYLSLVNNEYTMSHLQPYLKPGLWTSFDREGLLKLSDAFKKLK